jgi:prepilin-type N-terminal cleavage/methylation domain-containing protein
MLRDKKGFTLLEILASLTILATVVLVLVQLFSGSLNQATQADRYLNGVYLAQQKFSQLEMDDFKTENLAGEFEDQANYRWQLEILPYDSPVNNEDDRIKIEKVSLRVYWEDKAQEKEVQLVSLKVLGETHAAPADQLDPSSKSASNKPKKAKIKSVKTSSPSIFNNSKGSKNEPSKPFDDFGDDNWDKGWDDDWDDLDDDWEDSWFDE